MYMFTKIWSHLQWIHFIVQILKPEVGEYMVVLSMACTVDDSAVEDCNKVVGVSLEEDSLEEIIVGLLLDKTVGLAARFLNLIGFIYIIYSYILKLITSARRTFQCCCSRFSRRLT